MYFGEKHGKSYADGLFARLKAWMAYKIKARHFVVTSAADFYKYCRQEYQTPRKEGCQHYRVEFQLICPSDIRRHQDSDLDEAVPKTQQIYSIHNTPDPLTLKVCHVPCLCTPCITEVGQCLNASHTDPWKLVNLIPERGANLKKYQKRKQPDVHMITEQEKNSRAQNPPTCKVPLVDTAKKAPNTRNASSDEESDDNDDDLRSIIFHGVPEDNVNTKNNSKSAIEENAVTDTENVTDTQSAAAIPTNRECSWVNPVEEVNADDLIDTEEIPENVEIDQDLELIDICSRASKDFELASNIVTLSNLEDTFTLLKDILDLNTNEEITEEVLWMSLLSAFDSCTDYEQLLKIVMEIKDVLPPLKPGSQKQILFRIST